MLSVGGRSLRRDARAATSSASGGDVDVPL
jgi:hypothetical protein